MSSLSWDYISKNKANKQFSFYLFLFFSTGPTRPKQTSAWRPARHFHPSSLAPGLLLVLETPRCSVPHQTHSSLLPLSLWNSYRGLCNFSIPKLYNQVPAQWLCAAGRSKHKADDQRGGDSCRCILPHSFHVLPSYTHSSDVLQIIISLLGESNPPGGVKGSDHSVQIRYRSEKHQRSAV